MTSRRTLVFLISLLIIMISVSPTQFGELSKKDPLHFKIFQFLLFSLKLLDNTTFQNALNRENLK
jgi:hypothetical protein